MVLYLCVLIVFSHHQESLKQILIDGPPPQGGSVTILVKSLHEGIKAITSNS
jgi:hypothetical protein